MSLCQDFRACLYDFTSGELPPQRAELFARHLTVCAACAAELSTYRRAIEAGKHLKDVPPPAQVLERLRQALKAEAANSPPPPVPNGRAG